MKENRREINACLRRFCELNSPARGSMEGQAIAEPTALCASDWARFLGSLKVGGEGRLHEDGRYVNLGDHISGGTVL